MKKGQREQELSSKAYLDSNLFIYAAIDNEKEGDNARKIIESVSNGSIIAFTAALTIDEVIWEIQKNADRAKAAESAGLIINIPNLEIIETDRNIIKDSIKIYQEKGMDPRDAIHLASMISKKITILISSDPDFDNIEGIKRIDFTK